MRKIHQEALKKLTSVRKEAAEGSANYNIRQKRCFAIIANAVQKYIPIYDDIDWTNSETVRKNIPLTSKGFFRIEIPPQLIVSGKHSYNGVLETLRKMTEIWITTIDENDTKRHFVLFSHYKEENGRYFAEMDIISLQFMLNCQKKYTVFHLNSYLKLNSTYTMDLYMYLSANFNRKEWRVDLECFKKKIGIPQNYKWQNIKEQIILPAFEEFQKTKSFLNFAVEPIYVENDEDHGKRGRKPVNALEFKIYTRDEINDDSI